MDRVDKTINIPQQNLISLKESFKYPNDWNHDPCDSSFMMECYKECVDFGIFNLNDKKSLVYVKAILASCIYMWPLCNHTQSMITGRFIIWSFLIDDYLDSLEINDDKANSVVLNVETALIDGIVTNKDSKLEEYTVFFRNKLLQYCGNDRMDAFNLMISEIVNCVWTLVPFSKIHDKEKNFYPSFELYKCIRTINIGLYVCCALSILLFKEFDVKHWINPRFKKILNRASIQVSITNDAVSYGKEVLNDNGYCNSFYFLQKQSKSFNSFEQVCEFLFKEANSSVLELINEEISFLNEFQKDSDEYINAQKLLTHIHYLVSGNFNWSIYNNPRYQSTISPFIETKENHIIGKYNNVISSIFNQ